MLAESSPGGAPAPAATRPITQQPQQVNKTNAAAPSASNAPSKRQASTSAPGTQQGSGDQQPQQQQPNKGGIDIKLFVGRLPTSATEVRIRPLFERVGEVLDVIIIRDKPTGAHKGSAFVRMASITCADAAIRALHGSSDVAGASSGPLVVNYANGEPERLGFTPGSLIPGEDEAKVFVGSLPRDVTDQALLDFFAKYGQVHGAYLLLDNEKKKCKGCGFIKFRYKEEALLAIKQLHGIVTFPGAHRRLEVRIAEPKKHPAPLYSQQQQQMGNYHQWEGGRGMRGDAGAGGGRYPSYPHNRMQQAPMYYHQQQGAQSYQAYQQDPNQYAGAGGGGAYLNDQRNVLAAAVGGGAYCHPVVGATGGPAAAAAVAAAGSPMRGAANPTQAPVASQQPTPPSNSNPRCAGPWKEYFTPDGSAYYHNEQLSRTQWEVPPEFLALVNPQPTVYHPRNAPHNPVAAQQNAAPFQTLAVGAPAAVGAGRGMMMGNPATSNVAAQGGGGGGFQQQQQPQQQGNAAASQSDLTGPPGANVFVFHVPPEWGRAELAAHFAPFGSIKSAKVIVDQATGRNKGYGFVSYDNIQSAVQAADQMEGKSVGSKKLHVTIKDGEGAFALPYQQQLERMRQQQRQQQGVPAAGGGGSATTSTTAASSSNAPTTRGPQQQGASQNVAAYAPATGGNPCSSVGGPAVSAANATAVPSSGVVGRG